MHELNTGIKAVILASSLYGDTVNRQILGFYTSTERAIHWFPEVVGRYLGEQRGWGIRDSK